MLEEEYHFGGALEVFDILDLQVVSPILLTALVWNIYGHDEIVYVKYFPSFYNVSCGKQ